MMKLKDVRDYYGVDYIGVNGEGEGELFYRLRKCGDIQIWGPYIDDTQVCYECVDWKTGTAKKYVTMTEAMSAGLLYYFLQIGIQTADEYVTS